MCGQPVSLKVVRSDEQGIWMFRLVLSPNLLKTFLKIKPIYCTVKAAAEVLAPLGRWQTLVLSR
jgi:hypothetical protein